MLKNLTEDTGQGDGAVVGRVGFIPFFEDRNELLSDTNLYYVLLICLSSNKYGLNQLI